MNESFKMKKMKKLIAFLLLLTSFFGYLEWAPDNHGFIFQLEAGLFRIASADASSVVHPFILLPFIGQLLLLISLFRKNPGRWLSFAGMACTGILLVFLFIIGLLSHNWKITLSALPFMLTVLIAIRIHLPQKA